MKASNTLGSFDTPPTKPDQKKTSSYVDKFTLSPGQMSEKSQLLTEAMSSYSSETQSSVNDDDDDYSRVSSSQEDEDESTFEDYASNLLFLLGSILFVWLAVWDLLDDDFGWGDDDDSTDDDGYKGSPIKIMGTMLSDPYVALSAIAALLYVFDACFQMAKLFCHGDATSESKSNSDTFIGNEIGSDRESMLLYSDDQKESVCNYYRQDSNDVGHRLTLKSNNNNLCGSFWKRNGKCITSFLVGSTFGIAAFLDLVSGLIVDWDEDTSDMFDMVAVHLYLINSLILCAPIFSKCFHNPRRIIPRYRSEKLEYVGDLLFLAGSMIDVMCSYINLDETASISDWFFLLSAVLWLIDACFYIAADWIAFHEEDLEEDDDIYITRLSDVSHSTRSSVISMKYNPVHESKLLLQNDR